MAIYHIVLFKLKPGVSSAQVKEWAELGSAMVGKIPGLLKWDCNSPLPVTANRTGGYDMGLVAILETPEHVTAYGHHPAHLEVHKMREILCSETIAFDFIF